MSVDGGKREVASRFLEDGVEVGDAIENGDDIEKGSAEADDILRQDGLGDVDTGPEDRMSATITIQTSPPATKRSP